VSNTGDAVSRILVPWWKREAICAACRVRKSASLLTTSIVFGVAAGEPIFRYGKCFSGAVCGSTLRFILNGKLHQRGWHMAQHLDRK